jgi:transcriptional regulator with XRE-family HTH domain
MPSHAQKHRSGNATLRSTRREPAGAPSRRLPNLSVSFSDRDFRASYTAHHLRAFLADQIRGLRGDASQKEFGARIGKPQSVVSRLENEDYGKVSLQTLIDVAARLDIGLVVRFVDFPTFLRTTADFAEDAMVPAPYSAEAVEVLVAREPGESVVRLRGKQTGRGVAGRK